MRRLIGSLLAPVGGEQDEAWQRAEELLRDSLTPAQYSSYSSKGYVEVASGMFPGRTYRIDGWRPVAVRENGRFIGAVCIRPREHLPAPDLLLARKLMIEGAEREFLRAGNWLQPAWRPAGTAPTLFVLLALFGPWLLQLRAFGAWGVLVLTFVAGVALSLALRWRRRARLRT